MTQLPFMPLDGPRFLADPMVDAMPGGEARGVYLLLLLRMWMNGGWIKADDRFVAKALDLDIRRWRKVYKPVIEPLLRRDFSPMVGESYTQKRLTEVRAAALETVAKNKARTARATAAKTAKSKQRRSVTSPPPATATENVTKAVTDIGTFSKVEVEKDRALPIKKAESPIPPAGQGLGASSGVPTATVDEPAALAALHRRGAALTPPSPSLLNSPIVKGNGHGTAAQPDADAAGDQRDQGSLPKPERARRTDAPAVGLFGALEAAIRAAKPNDDD